MVEVEVRLVYPKGATATRPARIDYLTTVDGVTSKAVFPNN
jgi:hypothetical protein